ncbi:hypothetical protein GIB67_024183 [Kingdonia uniflora]|uniref:Phosphotyrosine protein phosphatase I domain-containing protein n=1 Tax=Kingdonia uniflora TaxID=39325 RepID=A0A7J7LZQ0_9MAGN|nr:hypothetical protein GIB67_024183 [Kingdonia uniflora]
MRAASKRRGVAVTSISRPIRPSDFRDFDLILAMDLQNKVYNKFGIKVSMANNLSFPSIVFESNFVVGKLHSYLIDDIFEDHLVYAILVLEYSVIPLSPDAVNIRVKS